MENPVLTWLTSLWQFLVLWVPTSMEHLFYVVAATQILVHIQKNVIGAEFVVPFSSPPRSLAIKWS